MSRRVGTIDLDLRGVEGAIRSVQKLAKASEDTAKRRIVDTAYKVQAAARAAAPVDQGEVRSGVKVDIQQGGLRAEVRASSPHSAVVEEGRSPGEAMPPEEPIAAWMRRKGIDPDLLYPIRRKIGEEGIDARPFFAPAWDAEKGGFMQGLKDDLVRVTREQGGGR